MKPHKSTKTWTKTRKPNLLRHKSGRYYARAYAGGKEVWQSLKTSHYSVAEAKLAEFMKEHRELVCYSNPAESLERVPVRAKQLTLPSGDQFLQLVDVVEHAGAWCSQDCADFVRGLAFTGCRKGEAGQITWRDVDFEAGEIVVLGDPE